MTTPTVLVSGNVEREVEPDGFTVGGTVQIEAGNRESAHADLTKRFLALDQAVMALGSEDLEIRRSGLSSHMRHDKMRRWIAVRSLSIRCTDTSRVTEVVDTLSRVANVAIDGPNWFVDRANPVFGEVQTEAVDAARERAERYAAAFGARLGALAEVRDQGTSGAGRAWAAMSRGLAFKGEEQSRDLAELDLRPLPQTVYASVEVRWYLDLPS
jgi:uncharacterized protein YggE